ncbi:hypothetical protein CIB84_014330 [Bambusicola thoracicus]|uniref:Uncharacterized protein n=1 Tax=Bambusicola thoracicus TaxID=9083 RepID=A0A2P4SCT6_BAMTH|nr:hypothetical protein CIB84_014330 [Bambusicola thoracicus]
MSALGELRCFMTISGEPCVMTTGIKQKPMLCAGSWAVGQRYQPLAQLALDKGLTPSGWMMSVV